MAQYRQIQCEFWYEDAEVCERFSPEDKYFYLYLLTNPHTQQCGIYEISIKHICYETGYNSDTVETLLNRFEKDYNKIRYNRQTKEMAIKNWMKYNSINSPKVCSCISKELGKVKDKSLIEYVFNGIDTVCIPYFQSEKSGGEEEEREEEEKKKRKEKDTVFFNAIDQYFKDHSTVYYRDAKESAHLKRLETQLKDMETFTPLAEAFRALIDGTDDFWRQQPFIPSAMVSLLPRIRQTMIATENPVVKYHREKREQAHGQA